jgi:hypothetical protein
MPTMDILHPQKQFIKLTSFSSFFKKNLERAFRSLDYTNLKT